MRFDYVRCSVDWGGFSPMSRRMLQGLKEIADHLGLQSHSLDARRVLLSWIEREALPARRLAGRWYADATEIEEWWLSRSGGDTQMRAASHQESGRPRGGRARTP